MSIFTTEERETILANRRWLHEHPELSRREYETAQWIESTLQSYGISTHRVGETGVVGKLSLGDATQGRTIAFRADTDALPVTEDTGLSFASANDGVMHACGHDAHTAALLGAAAKLAKETDLNGTVKFLFQPAEEICFGAKEMVKAGEVDDVDRILAVHMCPSLPVGKFSVRGGECSASTDRFRIIVNGKSSHAATPHLAVDAIYVASQIVVAIQGIVARNLNPIETGVISVGHIQGGATYNVLAEDVLIEGTTRAFNSQVRNLLNTRLKEVAQGVAQTYGATIDFELEAYTDPLINDSVVVAEVESAVCKLFGEEAAEKDYAKVMLGDDFAFYLAKTKGMYIWVGSREGEDTGYPLHHPKFVASEQAIINAAELYVEYAGELLKKQLE